MNEMRALAWSVCIGLVSLGAGAGAQSPPAAAFALKSGDTVVMYGDSITAQNLYTQYVEIYTATRFPSLPIHFLNSGIGGDKVSGGYAGAIDTRLARDVFPYRPSMVTVMLGMNDGGYTDNTEALETAYTDGYKHLLEAIRTHVPGVHLTLLGPSPYDDVTRPPWLPGGYNGVLKHYAQLDQQMAGSFGATFTSLNPSVVALLQRTEALDPLLAQQLIPDRIHPATMVHWVMAEAVLKAWNAPALVSSVTLNADAVKVVEISNATLDSLAKDKGTLSWNETENALPLPFDRNSAADALLLRLTDIEQQMDREPLRVVSLKPGSYKLVIDDKTIGTFSAAEFQAGVNLALYSTPMLNQAQSVAYHVIDHDDARKLALHMSIDANEPQALKAVVEFEADLEREIYEAAVPKSHRYQLIPTEIKP